MMARDLLNSYGLGEITWTIDVATPQNGNMISQQLHWNDS